MDAALQAAVDAALADPPQRVRLLTLPDGRRVWLKRVENLTPMMRWQKGDPEGSLREESRGLRVLAERAVPAVAVLAEGPGWLVLADVGETLLRVSYYPGMDDAERLAAFAAGGRALGMLHWAGLVHGRPAVRDICWDGHEARFIDLERFRHGRRGGMWQAADLVMFVQTCFTQWPEELRWMTAAVAAYAVHAPPGAMARARRLALWLAPLGWLAQGVAALRPRSREARAVGLTLRWLRQWRDD